MKVGIKDYPNPNFRVCGIGAINNKGERPKGVVCTDVNVIDPADGGCKNPETSEVYSPPEGVFCVQWSNQDNNLCAGDFGGELFLK